MFQVPSKSIKTNYKCVREVKLNCSGVVYYKASKKINGKWFTVSCVDINDAARALDVKLIQSGLEPINILKRTA